MICEVCGCTDERACVDDHGNACYWPIDTDPFDPVCSRCREEEEKMFPETDEELEAFAMMTTAFATDSSIYPSPRPDEDPMYWIAGSG